MLCGSILLLVSLPLRWRATSGLQYMRPVTGWTQDEYATGSTHQLVALAAALLLGMTAVALVHPAFVARAPLGRLSLVTGGLAIWAVLDAHASASQSDPSFSRLHPEFGQRMVDGHGAYIGGAAAVLLVLAPLAFRYRELGALRSPKAALATLLTGVAVVLMLVPWMHSTQPVDVLWAPRWYSAPAWSAGAFALCLLLCVPAAWLAPAGRLDRPALPLGSLLFLVVVLTTTSSRTTVMWASVGVVGALALLGIAEALPLRELHRPPWRLALVWAVAAAVVVSLFLPWERDCREACTTWSAWDFTSGATVGVLALATALVATRRPQLPVSALELALGTASMVGVLALVSGSHSDTTPTTGVALSWGAAATAGSAALLVVAAALAPGLSRPRWRTLAPRAPAVLIAAAAATLTIASVSVGIWLQIIAELPSWIPFWIPSDAVFSSVLPIVTPVNLVPVLLAIWTLGVWVRGSSVRPWWLVVSASALLGAAAVQLYLTWTIFREGSLTHYGGGMHSVVLGVLALVLLLAGLVAWWRDGARCAPAAAPAIA
jgi:hypothetical protein